MNIRIKRVYERPDKEDGTRVLVDRLWPRGLTKANASVDLWLKEIAPSTELRKWFGHDPGKTVKVWSTICGTAGCAGSSCGMFGSRWTRPGT